MRKLVMSLSVLAGLLFAGAAPASANAAAGLTAMQVQVDKSPGLVTEARWHRGWGHRGWGWRHHRRWGPGLYFGFGWPYYYGYYPRHRYYYDDDDYYGGPYYGYYGGYRHRHWRHHRWGHRGWYGHRGWGGRHHGWGHGGHRGHGGHHRH